MITVQVMRAEAEAVEEDDSAFRSNHDVLRNSIYSPVETSPKAQTTWKKGKVEEEEEEEEEGMVSWASVRMQGDRQKQRAAKEAMEVLKG